MALNKLSEDKRSWKTGHNFTELQAKIQSTPSKLIQFNNKEFSGDSYPLNQKTANLG